MNGKILVSFTCVCSTDINARIKFFFRKNKNIAVSSHSLMTARGSRSQMPERRSSKNRALHIKKRSFVFLCYVPPEDGKTGSTKKKRFFFFLLCNKTFDFARRNYPRSFRKQLSDDVYNFVLILRIRRFPLKLSNRASPTYYRGGIYCLRYGRGGALNKL